MYSLHSLFVVKDDSLFLCLFTSPSGLAAVLVKAVKFCIQLNTGDVYSLS